MELKNCINCGAPLSGKAVCEYCGTDYSVNAKHDGFSGEFDKNASIGTIKLFGVEYKAYVSNIQVEYADCVSARTLDGKISVSKSKPNLLLEVVAYND